MSGARKKRDIGYRFWMRRIGRCIRVSAAVIVEWMENVLDDNRMIQGTLLGADTVVFVTPIYYFGMSAQLKMVITVIPRNYL